MLRCGQTATLRHRPTLPPSHKRTLGETEKAFLPFFPANRFLANWEGALATASTKASLPEVGDITSKQRWTMQTYSSCRSGVSEAVHRRDVAQHTLLGQQI